MSGDDDLGLRHSDELYESLAAMAENLLSPEEKATLELMGIVRDVENCDDAIAKVNDQKALKFAVAKARGFDPKAIKEIIKLRKMGREERRERDDALELYRERLRV